MDIITISASASSIVAAVVVFGYALYVAMLGAFPAFRREINELLSEVFDASMSETEKNNLGPTLAVPSAGMLLVLGGIFLVLNIEVVVIPALFIIPAALFTAKRRKEEMKLEDLKALADEVL